MLGLPPSPCSPTQGQHMSPGQLDLKAETKRMLSVASIFPTMAQMDSFREPLRRRFLLCRDRLPFLCRGWKTAVLREKASRGWFAR